MCPCLQHPGRRADGPADLRGAGAPCQSCSCLGLIVSLLRLTNDCLLGIGSHPEGKGKSVCVSPCWSGIGQNGSLSRSDFLPQTWSGTGHTFLGHNGSFRIFQLGVGGPRNLLFQQVRFLWKLTFFFPWHLPLANPILCSHLIMLFYPPHATLLH